MSAWCREEYAPQRTAPPSIISSARVAFALLNIVNRALRLFERHQLLLMVRRKTIGGLARIRSSGSIGKSGMTH
jgi:hypothetical protein